MKDEIKQLEEALADAEERYYDTLGNLHSAESVISAVTKTLGMISLATNNRTMSETEKLEAIELILAEYSENILAEYQGYIKRLMKKKRRDTE